MRSTADRIRHALSFEIIALLIIIPVWSLGFGKPMQDIGVVAAVSSAIATAWVYVFNGLFDRVMLRLAGHLDKSFRLRILHTLLFEAGMLIVLLPFLMWYLELTLVEAFLLDVSFTIFYLVYTFVFNWLYDVVFPPPPAPTS
ncbi:PACE efflux transporter [Roseovarius spongiae]|uniref:PACE efflux transporter n=1 Tax=Roseovarius spongiae TaxID=2320272 RepID=A0A3A8BC53_9RHOB|nr:PACE efflux transporter [Roseovarius spongiae]RKF17184.1 PACE efflux transporter [Roseovarius spongiae]